MGGACADPAPALQSQSESAAVPLLQVREQQPHCARACVPEGPKLRVRICGTSPTRVLTSWTSCWDLDLFSMRSSFIPARLVPVILHTSDHLVLFVHPNLIVSFRCRRHPPTSPCSWKRNIFPVLVLDFWGIYLCVPVWKDHGSEWVWVNPGLSSGDVLIGGSWFGSDALDQDIIWTFVLILFCLVPSGLTRFWGGSGTRAGSPWRCGDIIILEFWLSSDWTWSGRSSWSPSTGTRPTPSKWGRVGPGPGLLRGESAEKRRLEPNRFRLRWNQNQDQRGGGLEMKTD